MVRSVICRYVALCLAESWPLYDPLFHLHFDCPPWRYRLEHFIAYSAWYQISMFNWRMFKCCYVQMSINRWLWWWKKLKAKLLTLVWLDLYDFFHISSINLLRVNDWMQFVTNVHSLERKNGWNLVSAVCHVHKRSQKLLK